MRGIGWHLIRGFARLCVWAYYRLYRVEHGARIPKRGPVLFVANHPNALVDAGVVLCAVPRPLRFVAGRNMLTVPVIGWLLRTLGLAPVIRVGGGGAGSDAKTGRFAALHAHLGRGGAAVVFPERHISANPELSGIRPGAAALALGAEDAAEFGLDLQVVPLGLHYEPRQQFRGEVHVRVGEAFGIRDLAHQPRAAAVRTIQERIAASLRPLVVHLERVDLEPLVNGVADVYDEYQRADAAFLEPRPRGEVVRLAASCLNHFLVADPSVVDLTRRHLRRYRRLARRAGIRGEAVEARARRWRSSFAFFAALVGAVAGFPVFLLGCLTGTVPYRITGFLARRMARGRGAEALPRLRIVLGAVVFGLFWGTLALLVYLWTRSPTIAAVAFGAFATSGPYALFYTGRIRVWRARLAGLQPLGRPGIRRVARARTRLLRLLDSLAIRYREETGAQLLAPRRRRWHQRFPWRTAAAAVVIGFALFFLWGLRDTPVPELSGRPSPWASVDTDRARDLLQDDARTLTSLLDTLAELEGATYLLKAGFDAGKMEFTNVEHDRAIRRALLTYLSCRSELYRLAWFYRQPDRPGEAGLGEAAFVLSYAAAVELVRRGMQLVALFEGSPRAIRKLNEGDRAWGVPPGTYDRVRKNLSNSDIYDELAAATARFESLSKGAGRPDGALWARIWKEAESGRRVVRRLAEKRWDYRWEAAVARAEESAKDARYAASSFFAGLVGGVRVRQGDLARGLISDAQVGWLREDVLEPGDILLERRNWALTNVFLPGFWTHAALFVGGPEGVRALGIEDDERVRPHLAALGQPGAHGRPRLILEALAPGVVLNTLEKSVGEADALCVLRPRLPHETIADGVAHALRHYGKPYDFDFDFFSSDKLVCTELVYRAYHGPLDLKLQTLMGRETLPAMAFLEKWEAERGSEEAQLEMICFLDAVEDEGVAREADEAVLLSTLDRPGITLLRTDVESATWPRVAVIGLAGLFMLALVFLRRRD